MISIGNFERRLFSCPEVNMSEYAPASDEEFLLMETEFSTEFVCVFPFVRKKDGKRPYVEIYIWDVMLYPDVYRRFIICDEMRLPELLEKQLFDHCKEPFIYIDERVMDQFNNALLDCFPKWHYIPYSSVDIGRSIEHIYYASHCSGPKEILYKAGLENIAYNLDRIPEYNLIGQTAPEIIGHDLPFKLLRILDQPELIDSLYADDSMKHALLVYRSFAGVIGEGIPSADQWRYLDRLYSDRRKFEGLEFNRSFYMHLRQPGSEEFIDSYWRYCELYEDLKIEKRMKIPKIDDLLNATEKLERFYKYSKESPDLDEQIRYRKKIDSHVYEYSDDSYIVTMPGSCADICKESIDQENCLMDYICDHALGETTILFLRKKDKPDESYVTMEVKNRKIMQVYGRCNSFPEKEVYQFLIEKYSKDKSVLIDQGSMKGGREL